MMSKNNGLYCTFQQYITNDSKSLFKKNKKQKHELFNRLMNDSQFLHELSSDVFKRAHVD